MDTLNTPMRYQSHAASCGPNALRTALLARGVLRSEDELATLSGCTVNGTTAKGMLHALVKVAGDDPDLRPSVLKELRPDVAVLRLLEAHRSGYVAILCVDGFEHWVVSFGTLGAGDRTVVHVADGGDHEIVKHYKPQQLLERWRGPGERGVYYGIVV